MGRKHEDIVRDNQMLQRLKINSHVRYNGNKKSSGLTGVITTITNYYSGYKSVTVKLDNSNKHINCSPRNLELC